MKDVKRILVVVLALAYPSAAFAANNWWKGLAEDGLWSNDGNWQNAGGAPSCVGLPQCSADAFLTQGLEPDSDLPTSVALGAGGMSAGNIIIDGDNSLNSVLLGPKWDWQLPYSATVTVPAGDSLTLTGTFLMGTWNTRQEPQFPGDPNGFILAGSNMLANLDGTVVADSFSYTEEDGNWVNIGGSVTVDSVVDDPETDTWATAGNGLAMTGGTLTVTGNLESFFDDLHGSGFLVATNGDYDAVFDGTVTTITGSGESFCFVIPGDFNEDGGVDGLDFLVWQQQFGETLDADDLADWEANYGMGAGCLASVTAAASMIPEPSTFVLLLLALGSTQGRRQRFAFCNQR
jgi:hypothetical protein